MRVKNDEANQLGLFPPQSQPETEMVVPLVTKRSVTPKRIAWFDPALLSDHPLNAQLFGRERLSNVEDLVLAIGSGYDAGRAIKCVQQPDGNLTIIDGHRRKRAAEIVNCQVAVIIESFKSEADEIEEMILSNLVKNRSYNRCGVGTAVRLIQLVNPRQVKRGRRTKKNQDHEASISKGDEKGDAKASLGIEKNDPVEAEGTEGRRAYYAHLLGISEKTFRLVDYVLRHGNDDERRELDVGPRKLRAIYNAVRARITGEEEGNGRDPRVVARAARAALRATTRLFSLMDTGDCTEEVELSFKRLAQLAKSEVAGAKPEGSTTAYVLKLYRNLFKQALRGTGVAKK
jgi:hypothetical protein